MQQRERNLRVILTSIAFGLAIVAASEASDQSREEEFEKEKIAYIKQYALPKALAPSKSELLFTQRATQTRPVAAPVGKVPSTSTIIPAAPNDSGSNLSQPPAPANEPAPTPSGGESNHE